MINTTITTSSEKEITFSSYCEQWLQLNTHHFKHSTYIKYKTILEKHILTELGTFPLSALTISQIGIFTDTLLYRKKLAPKTVTDVLALLHSILIFARQSQGMELAPVQIVYPRKPREKLRVLSQDEQIHFTRYLRQDLNIYKFAILLALTTGLRVGELCGLKGKNISLKKQMLSVEHTVQRIQLKNALTDRKTTLLTDSPKTSSSIRSVPLTPEIAVLIPSFLPNDEQNFLLTGTKTPCDPRKLQRKLQQYTRDCALENVHFHTLRHTFATRCVEIGCDIKTLSEIMGHANVTITMNRYVHPSIELKKQTIQKLADAGFGGTCDN